jgi:nucleoside-diphosphate-sugar epimerase
MTADRRVLVTGAAGFIGRHTVEPLLARGFEVHGVSHTGRGEAAIAWHAADLLDPTDRARLLAEVTPSHLLHAAWYVEPGKYAASPVNLDWVAASIDLARRFEAGGGRRFVGVGTCFEYAFGPAVLPEDAPLGAGTVYGRAKAALGTALEALAAATGLAVAWPRLFYLFGPHEDRRRLIADIASSLVEGRAVETGDGLVRRDYQFVEDAGAALAAIVDSDVTGAINVATGEAPPVRDLVERVARAVGREDLVRFGARPTPAHEPPEIRADVSRLTHEVGFDGVTPVDEAVRRTVEWWRSQTRVGAA